MEANELSCKDLMVGDWVMVYPWDGTPWKPKKITDINFHSWEGDDFCDSVGVEGWDELSLDQIKPIPLTPEILEKNGFIKDAYKDDRLTDMYHLLVPTGFERNSFTIQVSLYRKPICGVSTLVKCWGWIPPHNSGMNDIHLCSANYVHQLQHAMRLCGIEKEIVL